MNRTTFSWPLLQYSYAAASPNVHGLSWLHETPAAVVLEVLPQHSPTTYRLKVVSKTDASGGSSTATTYVDLDLNFYSTLRASTKSSPIKAFYRDNLVLLFYLDLTRPGVQSAYRRFRLKFTVTSHAMEFVGHLAPILPCKLAPTNSNGPDTSRSPTCAQNSQMQLLGPFGSGNPRLLEVIHTGQPTVDVTSPSQTYGSSGGVTHEYDLRPERPGPVDKLSSALSSDVMPMRISTGFQGLSEFPCGSYSGAPLSSPAPLGWSDTANMREPPVRSEGSIPFADGQRISTAHQESSLPHMLSMPTNRISSEEDVLAGCRDSSQASRLHAGDRPSSLYYLTGAELEGAIAEVIREAGFVELMRNVRNVWNVR